MNEDCVHQGAHLGTYNLAGQILEAHTCNKLGQQCAVGSNAPGLVDCERCEYYIDFPSSIRKCVHRGPVARSDISNLCGARGKEISIFGCSVHGECAIGRYCRNQTVHTCLGCDDCSVPEDPAPAGNESDCHLMYHIWPKRGPVWRWNVQELLKRIHVFNRVRTVGIVLSPDSDDAATVQAAFGDHRIDNWIVAQNDRSRGEGVTFREMLSTLPQSGRAFYAHAKGVKHGALKPAIKLWVELMYRGCLDRFDLVDEALKTHFTAGCLRNYYGDRYPHHHNWHFAGTFFWFQCREAFARDWHRVTGGYYQVEHWPGQLFRPEEAYCLFGDDQSDGTGLYELPVMEAWDREARKLGI